MFQRILQSLTLTNIDIIIITFISFLTSILVILFYIVLKNRKHLYIDLANTTNNYFGKDKNGYLEKNKVYSDKTTYVECNFILSIANNSNKPYTFRNICIINKKGRKRKILEEGSLNVNGTAKSLAGVTSYDKLKHLVVKPYECVDYDVNIRLSKDEYLKYKKIYLSYKGFKNKIKDIKIKIKKVKHK